MSCYYFTLGLFLLTAHMAAGVPADCGQTYQNTLKSLLTQRENCDTAGFKDCCQVLLFNSNYDLCIAGTRALLIRLAPMLPPAYYAMLQFYSNVLSDFPIMLHGFTHYAQIFKTTLRASVVTS